MSLVLTRVLNRPKCFGSENLHKRFPRSGLNALIVLPYCLIYRGGRGRKRRKKGPKLCLPSQWPPNRCVGASVGDMFSGCVSTVLKLRDEFGGFPYAILISVCWSWLFSFLFSSLLFCYPILDLHLSPLSPLPLVTMHDDDAHRQFIRICHTCSVMKLTSLVICLLPPPSPLGLLTAPNSSSSFPSYFNTGILQCTSLHTAKIGMWATGIPNRH